MYILCTSTVLFDLSVIKMDAPSQCDWPQGKPTSHSKGNVYRKFMLDDLFLSTHTMLHGVTIRGNSNAPIGTVRAVRSPAMAIWVCIARGLLGLSLCLRLCLCLCL